MKDQGITYDCNICDYKAKIQSALKTHIEVDHEGLRVFCDECPKQYKKHCEMLKHKSRKHGYVHTRRKKNKPIYK